MATLGKTSPDWRPGEADREAETKVIKESVESADGSVSDIASYVKKDKHMDLKEVAYHSLDGFFVLGGLRRD